VLSSTTVGCPDSPASVSRDGARVEAAIDSLQPRETHAKHCVHIVPVMDVVLVRWPEEAARLTVLRADGTPRLLLVGPQEPPPESADCLEDWIRLPADDRDVRARVASLALRASQETMLPELDDDGLLRFRGEWVSLSPVERGLAHALVERFGAVVTRDALGRRAWPNGAPTRNALDVHVLRLRRRIAPLGLEVRTVRSRGYLLQAMSATAANGGG